jgi:hypothetical protein
MKHLIRITVVIAMSALLSGCGLACTEAGCESGLTVKVRTASGGIPESFSGTAKFSDRTIAFSCDGTLAGTAEFQCFNAGEVKLSGTGDVELTIGTETRSLTPAYTEHRPNGPFCAPVCSNASETVTLP